MVGSPDHATPLIISHTLVRDIKKQSSVFPPLSVAPLLSSPNHTITAVSVRPNGAPVINCSNGVVYSYDSAFMTWVKLSERWWSEGSDAWPNRSRNSSTQSSNRGIMSSVESSISGAPDDNVPAKARPTWWSTALTLGHLETRLNATKLLDSPHEYKQALLLYAKKIADESFRAKAEELIKELYGPIYQCVCHSLPSRIGLLNYSLLTVALAVKKFVLQQLSGYRSEIFSRTCCQYSVCPDRSFQYCPCLHPLIVRSKTLTKLGMDWQDLLKRSSSDE